jgi:hypothetical protein
MLALAGGVAGSGPSAPSREPERRAPATAFAAPAPAKKARPAEDPEPESRLETVLRAWAKAADAVKSAHYGFKQKEDKAFGTKTIATGTVQFARPHLLRLDMHEGKETTIFLITQQKVHLFRSRDRTEAIFSRGLEDLDQMS